MEYLNPHILTLTSLLFLITMLLWSIITMLLWSIISRKDPSRRKNLPPSPPKLPIIGNLHQLGSLPHRSLRSLAEKHGPLMLLHFGSVPVLIVSSAEWASEFMRTNDQIFASRPAYKAFKKLLYDCKDISTAPYGEHWRKMKSIFVHELVSNARVRTSHFIREEETALVIKEIEQSCGSPYNLSAMFDKYTNDAICRSAFGKKYSETENGKRCLLLLSDFMQLSGTFNVGDFIPWLGWIGRVNGFDKSLDRVAKEMDRVFESVIQEHIDEAQKGENFMDILLQIYTDQTAEVSIDRDSIKALILDTIIGGTDTTSAVLEWAMTELLRHPTVMGKLQSEVRRIVKQNEGITYGDLEKMHYLKAVIKEALRCYPASPLLLPRLASKDVQIRGFDISAGTVVIINGWAIGRDPVYWDEPEKFMPERFLNSSRDFIGVDFEFIPFGAGRRICPGIALALVSMEVLLANLVGKFDWKLPNGIEGDDLDMSLRPGITIHRVVPLFAVASPYK